MSRKILLASGCSFTAPDKKSFIVPDLDVDFPRWPQQLADKLDMKCVNLGMSGLGNFQIGQRIFEYLLNNKQNIGLICVLWSEWTRTTIHPLLQPMNPIISGLIDNSDDPLAIHMVWSRIYNKFLEESIRLHHPQETKSVISNGGAKKLVERNFFENIRFIYDIVSLAENKNIPHIHFQGLRPFMGDSTFITESNMDPKLGQFEFLEKIYAPPQKDLAYLFEKYKNSFINFIGYPCSQEFGGYNVSDKLWVLEEMLDSVKVILGEKNILANSYFVHPDDNHPNELGHEVIADEFHKKVEELYPKLISKKG